MTDIREEVRRRANYACEFCGVREKDCGGELTIDHFQPKSKNGSDTLENLLYCCIRCNQYKQDYWPANPREPSLWNPRQEPASQHFLQLDDGTLYPLTPTGSFTLKRLRLNRPFGRLSPEETTTRRGTAFVNSLSRTGQGAGAVTDAISLLD